MGIFNFCCSLCKRGKKSGSDGDVESDPLNGSNASPGYSATQQMFAAPVESLTTGFHDFASSTNALQLCLINVFMYLVIAVVAFSYIFEKFTVVDSLYFGVVTFTTIGYGDLSPTTQGGQLFTIFFALYGISILGVFLGIIGERIVEAQEAAVTSARDRGRKDVMVMFKEGDHDDHKELEDQMVEVEEKKERSIWADMWELVVKEAPIVILISVLAIVLGHFEGWSVITSLYYCVITSTTVGFGDLSPDTEWARGVSIVFLPLTVAVFGEILGRIAGFYLDRKAAKAEQEFLHRQLTLSDLAVMDIDGDGDVTMGEFLSFMLVAMQKVDQESIDELKALFRSLDADNSGALQKEDLMILAERRQGRRKDILKASMKGGLKSSIKGELA